MFPVFIYIIGFIILGLVLNFGMADQTLKGTKGYLSIVRGAGGQVNRRNARRDYRVNGASHYVGKLCTRSGESTAYDIGLYNPGDELLGVIERPHKQPQDPSVNTEWTIDDALDDNSMVVVIEQQDWDGMILSLFCEAQAGPLVVRDGYPIVAGPSGNVRVGENQIWGRQKIIDFFQDGNVTTGTALAKAIAQAEGAIVEATITSATDGDDGSILVDVNIGGTTIFTTQGNRPTILSTDGNNFVDRVLQADMDGVNTFVKDAVITIDVDDDGGTTPGTDLKVEVWVDYGQLIGVADGDQTLNATDINILNVRMGGP